MRYRSIHTVDKPQGYTYDDLRASFVAGAPQDTRVKVTRHSKQGPLGVTIEFSAASDALAKQHAAEFRTTANILGPSDHLTTQVLTRNGWAVLS